MKKGLFTLLGFFLVSLAFIAYKSSYVLAQTTDPTSVGICHSVANLGNPAISWGYTVGEGNWRTLEPQRGVFNWTALDAAIATAQANNKKVWIQVLTDDPSGTVPQWALDAGMHQLPSEYNISVYPTIGDKPVQWDPLYLQFLREVVEAMAARYDNNDTVEAVLIASGGHYGEMSLHGFRPIRDAYLSEMAITTGLSVTELATLQPTNWPVGTNYIPPDINDPRILFDQMYLQKAVFPIIDIYARSFRNKPVVLQLGTTSMPGLNTDGTWTTNAASDSRYVSGNAAYYAVTNYGNHVWLKQNGLGNWGGADWYNALFGLYQDDTRLIREVGHLEAMCNQPFDVYGVLNGSGCYNPSNALCCSRDGDACAWNTATVNAAINAGVSAICFQSNFFTAPSNFPCLTWSTIEAGLEANYNSYLGIPNASPPPTLPPILNVVAVTPPLGECTAEPYDVNGNGTTNDADDWIISDQNCGPGKFPQLIGTGSATTCGCVDANESLVELFNLVNGIMIPVSVIAGIFIIILAGYKILTSQGNPAELQTGKDNLTSAIIGLIFVLMAVSILRVIIKALITGDADPF